MAETTLPLNDPDAQEYACASDSMDFAMLIWSIALFFCFVAALTMHRLYSPYFKKLYSNFKKYIGEATFLSISIDFPEAYKFLTVLKSICSISCTCTLFIIVCTTIVFVSFKANDPNYRYCFILVQQMLVEPLIFSDTPLILIEKKRLLRPRYATHEYQYSWTVSAAYLAGSAPAGKHAVCEWCGVCVCVMCASLCVCLKEAACGECIVFECNLNVLFIHTPLLFRNCNRSHVRSTQHSRN